MPADTDAPYPPRRISSVGWLAGAILLQIVLLAVAASRNRHLLNTDAVAYLRLAAYYAEGRTDLTLSGYWGPMLSWILAALLKVGFAPLDSARIAMAGAAVLFLLGSLSVFVRFGLSPLAVAAGTALVGASTLYWSVEFIGPDLLVSGWICLAIAWMARPEWVTVRSCATVAGVLWALAYFAKAIAFPLAFAVTVAFAGLWRLARPTEGAAIVRAAMITLSVFVLVSLPWIVALSLKYDTPTFSTTGRIAHAIVGQERLEYDHPSTHTLHRPEAGRVTSWEDPSAMPYLAWSPLASPASAVYQMRLTVKQLLVVFRIFAGFDQLALGLLAAFGCVLIGRHWREAIAGERFRWSVVPLLAIAAVYAPIYVKPDLPRYFYLAYPFLFVASAGMVTHLTSRPGARWRRGIALAVVIVSFAVPAASSLGIAIAGIPNPACASAEALAAKIVAAGLGGPVAGAAKLEGGRAGLYLAYFLGEPWYGDEAEATPRRLADSGARLIVLARNGRGDLERGLDGDPAFRNLDGRLFATPGEAERFLLKVYSVVPRLSEEDGHSRAFGPDAASPAAVMPPAP